ncbi:glycosyl transferase, group 1 [Chitinispirillum alkaliphilum]|nr:glycosyl transferase, group 1 [Chitinispirillum alkaliphilum]
MKIVIINKHISDSLGGSEMQCDLIARGLTSRGHQVIYFAVMKKNKSATEYNGLPYDVVPFDIAVEDKGSELFKTIRPDIVYWRYNKNKLSDIVTICKRLSIPFVFAISSSSDVHFLPSWERTLAIYKHKNFLTSTKKVLNNFIYHLRAIHAYKNIDAITTLNSEYIDILPVKKQITIWNGVPTQVGKFFWEKPYCLWVASIKSIKRPELYISLSEKMADRIPELDFLMVGSIQDPSYKRIIEEASKQSNFHYLGPKSPEDVNKALKGAHCLVHTCQREGFGNNFIQSWLMGCPTISYNFDPDKLIKNLNIGFVSGNVDQMASDVTLLWNNKDLRGQIIKKAMTFAKENMTPEVMCEKLERFLEDVIANYENYN